MGLIGAIPAASASSAEHPARVGAVAVLCWVVSFACLAPPGPARRLAGRIIGGTLLLASLYYLGSELAGGFSLDLLDPAGCFLAFGVPGAYYAWKGRFRDAGSEP